MLVELVNQLTIFSEKATIGLLGDFRGTDDRSSRRFQASPELAPFRLYDLRHTFATRAAEKGIDLVTLAAMLGHSRIQMVLRYAHPSEEHQAAAIQKMNAAPEEKAEKKEQKAATVPATPAEAAS